MSAEPRRSVRIFQVDAFTDRIFGGNPAAVCPLEDWLPDELLQAIAAENNLSETAFFLTGRDPSPLRWFTPRSEVPLCGHATLAAAYVAMAHLHPERTETAFETLSGRLTVRRTSAGFLLDFPAVPIERTDPPDCLLEGLGLMPREVWVSEGDPNYLAILDSQAEVDKLRPDLRALERLHPHGVAVSAVGDRADFVSRYFAPGYGIPEDPVTGSIHCALGPYWSDRLGRRRLAALQLSPRGGTLGVRVRGERVELEGNAVSYLSGMIELDAVPLHCWLAGG